MKTFFTFITCFFSVFLCADSDTFSPVRLSAFYDTFLCEEKQDLYKVDLSTSCSLSELNSHIAPPPPFIAGYLPIVLVNHSTLPDDQVYVVLTGANQISQDQAFVKISPSTGIGKLVLATSGDNALNYSLKLSQLPIGSTGRVIYLPHIIGGEIWISMQYPLNMPVNGNSIVQPNFLSSSDPNYYTNYDIYEVAFTSNSTPNIAADATAVSFHSLSLLGYISTPSSVNNTSGLTQSRSTVMNHVTSTFAGAPNATEWNKLFLKNGSTILRVLSPGKGASANIFDQNYLDNAAAYGYSYLSNIWTSSNPGSFYRTNSLVLTIPNGSLDTYTGVINNDNTITFTGQKYGYTVVFAAPTTTAPTTTFNILSGKTLVQSDNSPNQADGVQLYKLFEEAIIAGLVPTANTLSNSYLLANQSNYYNINSNLSGTGQSTGPWYDLYSKALHSLGDIYTFAFDEPLWPQVQITSNTLVPNKTYMSITIESIQ